MSTAFNPYHKWLGIPPDKKTIDYYRLLGIPRFEHDAEVIRAAAEQRAAHLAKCMSGEHGELAKKLRAQVVAAAVCLLDPQKRSEYDVRIHERQSAAPSVERTSVEETEAEEADVIVPVNAVRGAYDGAYDVASLISGGSSARPSRIVRKKPKSSPWVTSPWMIWAIVGGAAAVIGTIIAVAALQTPSDKRSIAAAGAKPTTAKADSSTEPGAKPPIAAPIARHDSPSVAEDESQRRPVVPDRRTAPSRPRLPRRRDFFPVPSATEQSVPNTTEEPEPSATEQPAPKPSAPEPARRQATLKAVRDFPAPPETRPAGVSPREFLEKYGLIKYAGCWVVGFEKTLPEEGPKLAKLKPVYAKALDKAKAARRALQEADGALKLAKKEEHDLFHGGGFIDGSRIREVQKQLHEAEAKRAAAEAAANNAWADAEALTKSVDEKLKTLQEGYDDAKRQYASLVDAPAIRQAVKDFNADLDKPTSLGPTTFFRDTEVRVKALADTVNSTRARIPYKLEGDLRFVSVELNGKKTIEMAVDTGAELVSLTWQAALDAGLDPTKGEPVRMGDASGGVSLCYQVVIPHVRVGNFVADDVECVVSPNHGGRDIPLLLGQSFLKRFNYQFDTAEQVIVLSDAARAGH